MFQAHQWRRDTRNPIFPPGSDWFDCTACMNPFVLRRGDEYWMYYAGGDRDNRRRICLAIAPVDDITSWKRLGPLFDLGPPGAFDEGWCVLPCVHFINGKWHLYYSGRDDSSNGLQAFGGIGLYTSDDLLHWTQYSDEPVLRGDGFAAWPNNKSAAGGGTICECERDGQTAYRIYYTLTNGHPDKNLKVDQEKHSVCAESHDGIHWFDKRVLLSPRGECSYEDVAVTGLNVWREARKFRAIYSAIGTRLGYYSMCEAQSDDGLLWERGALDENLALAASSADGNGTWADRMCEYANIIEEDGKLRLFYCGNGIGATGVGTAVAEHLSGDYEAS
jgi:hypothetical protein